MREAQSGSLWGIFFQSRAREEAERYESQASGGVVTMVDPTRRNTTGPWRQSCELVVASWRWFESYCSPWFGDRWVVHRVGNFMAKDAGRSAGGAGGARATRYQNERYRKMGF
ncbi:hypothetical protein ANO11243_032880 [Dothideomycetidae sp. 11243]|nr:hypothetical protein ANO11243_032880 [fungal sp. No.11243]